MSLRASSPWPAPTPPPKRRRIHYDRQTIADQAQVTDAEQTCELFSGNNVFSCFPTADTVVPQHEWASFVWNSRLPQFLQTNLVDIFLFRADSQQQLLHYRNQINPSGRAGRISAQVNDTWFGTDGLNFNGTDTPFPFYWVVIRSDKTLDGSQVPQPIFTAVQTTVLDSVATSSSLAAASSSALAASLSSLSSASSVASVARQSSLSHSTSQPTGAVQNATSTSSFPHWAIAVIVILGFLAIACTGILIFLIIRRIRRRQRQTSSRNSIGSASPMMPRDSNNNPDMIQRYDSAGSPLLAPAVLAGGTMGAASGAGTTTLDGASTISDSGGPFSGADAAIMADAFRKMLRKPDFASRPVEEGESPEKEEGDAGAPPPTTGDSVLRGELAEEGRDIRSVSSSRGVKVESQPPPPPPDETS